MAAAARSPASPPAGENDFLIKTPSLSLANMTNMANMANLANLAHMANLVVVVSWPPGLHHLPPSAIPSRHAIASSFTICHPFSTCNCIRPPSVEKKNPQTLCISSDAMQTC
ncbi:hypothetical protein PMIN06_002020 [Paraphaeosphaeria minitans]